MLGQAVQRSVDGLEREVEEEGLVALCAVVLLKQVVGQVGEQLLLFPRSNAID